MPLLRGLFEKVFIFLVRLFLGVLDGAGYRIEENPLPHGSVEGTLEWAAGRI